MQSKTIPADQAVRARRPGTYVINEIFYSLQGEGINAGVPMVFVRFTDCNLRCTVANAGFDCDTEFMSGKEMTPPEIRDAMLKACEGYEAPKWVLLTGGEPLLQVDLPLLEKLIQTWNISIETNGTIPFPYDRNFPRPTRYGFHLCVSPKSAEHTIVLRTAHEVKYVRRAGQSLPDTVVKAPYKLVSPAAQPDGSFLCEDIEWCVELVKCNPEWRLSLQLHKLLGVR